MWELRREQLNLNHGNQELEVAVTNISHNLRTPLTAICGYLELLEQEESGDNVKKYIDVIRERTDSMRSLTEELFSCSLLAIQDEKLHIEQICINDILEQSIAGFYGVLINKRILPDIQMSEIRVMRQLDKEAVRRIFDNILSNAARYSDGDCMDYYKQIFKRKSFHLFRDTGMITEQDIRRLEEFIGTVKPLYVEIKTEVRIIPENETTCKRGGQFCLLFYSESKEGYLQNIGYLGEQIDLYLASKNIGALWFGIGRPKDVQINGLDFVIMISIAKMPEEKFRKDIFKSKRKPLQEIWRGSSLGVAEIARYAPSACNTQPWIVENTGKDLMVYRFKQPGKRGIMPIDKVLYYNKIDMGIFLFILESCLEHEGYTYNRILYVDTADDSVVQTLIAKYTYASCC